MAQFKFYKTEGGVSVIERAGVVLKQMSGAQGSIDPDMNSAGSAYIGFTLTVAEHNYRKPFYLAGNTFAINNDTFATVAPESMSDFTLQLLADVFPDANSGNGGSGLTEDQVEALIDNVDFIAPDYAPVEEEREVEGETITVKVPYINVPYINSLIAAYLEANGFEATANTTPAAPTIIADDTANTIDATHTLGDSEIMVSENNGSYVQFDGTPISVGDVARAAGYYKFKIKSATGRNESAVASSPAFTVAESETQDVTLLSTGWAEDPAGTWAIVGDTGNSITNKSIPSGEDGRVYMDFDDILYSSQTGCIMGLDTDSTNTPQWYDAWDFAFRTYGGTRYMKTLGSGTSGEIDTTTIPEVCKVGMARIGTDLLFQYSEDETTWTTLRTVSGVTTNELFLKFAKWFNAAPVKNPIYQPL
jgi:hypothetical protein